ncbi:MAG: hypothetical protein JKY65_06240 [Planctomycetes bacterium]|nr:hypothetical protein [Planctomycetota bacterium]
MDPQPEPEDVTATSAAPPKKRPLAAWLGFFVLLAVVAVPCALEGYVGIYSDFRTYDDEGYVMISVAQFVEGKGALYEEIYSNYGPASYLSKGAYYGLTGQKVTHDNNRALTLGYRMLAFGLIGLFVFARTKSHLLAIVAAMNTFLLGEGLNSGPGHPQELGLVLGCAALLLCCVPLKRFPRAVPVGIGLLLSTLVLTKINLGGLLGFGLVLTLIHFLPRRSVWERIGWGVALAGVLLPWILMRNRLGDGWFFSHALLVSWSTALALLALKRSPAPERVEERSVLWALIAFVAGCLVILAITCLSGSSPVAIWKAVIVEPIAFSSKIASPSTLPFPPLLYLVTATAALACLLWGPDSYRKPLVLVLRLTFGLVGCILPLCLLSPWDVGKAMLFSALPFAWILLIPSPRREGSAPSLARVALVLCAMFQALVAYPVAGSQVLWASVFLLPAGAISLQDVLGSLKSPTASARARLLSRVGAALALIAFLHFALRSPPSELLAFRQQRWPLNLPGATQLRFRHREVARLHWIVQNLRAHSATFTSLPGQGSFHFWTGIAPPTGSNVSCSSLLSEARQSETLTRLLESDRPCLLIDKEAFEEWESYGLPMAGPLFDGSQEHFVERLRLGSVALLGPRTKSESWREYLLFGTASFAGTESARPFPDLVLCRRESLTLSAWFRGQQAGVLLARQSAPLSQTPLASGLLVSLDAEGRLRVAGGDAVVSSSPGHNDGAWHHLALSFGRADLRVYLDGAPLGECGLERDDPAFAQLGSGFLDGEWWPFSGDLAEVFLAREPWSPARVAEVAKEPPSRD